MHVKKLYNLPRTKKSTFRQTSKSICVKIYYLKYTEQVFEYLISKTLSNMGYIKS